VGAGGAPPPPPQDEVFFFVFAFKICLPHQSDMPFLSGAPPPKKNPGSVPVRCAQVFTVNLLFYLN